jgi:hypothetical protein
LDCRDTRPGHSRRGIPATVRTRAASSAARPPAPEPVFVSSDRKYPTFNSGILDQYRYAEFLRDFTLRSKSGYKLELTVIRLPNDHGSSPRPGDGYPYTESFIADNDLALGKMVDTISHSSIRKDTAIFVIEDDAQAGVDHVDAHRSPVLIISPYTRRGYISHRHTSFASVSIVMIHGRFRRNSARNLLFTGAMMIKDSVPSW